MFLGAKSPQGELTAGTSTDPVLVREAGTDRCGERSGTSVDPCRAGPTSSAAHDGPAPRWSALHEALPHIRKEISQ
ncbi:hypothetical protein QF027_008945 [Streptomyces canus]|nr:hypothetical protein [Streptomyces canus]